MTCFTLSSNLKDANSEITKLKALNEVTKQESSILTQRYNTLASSVEVRLLEKDKKIKDLQTQADNAKSRIENLTKNVLLLETNVKKLSDRAKEREANTKIMRGTAYDLSYDSCGKGKGHPQYGMTATGKRATYKRTIATDPRVIPMGTKVRITFPDGWEYLNGIFVAEDTGGAVKGNTVDIFLGDYAPKTVDAFGVQKIKVERM